MPTGKRVRRVAVQKLGGAPRKLRVALRALYRAELVQVLVCVALRAITAGALKDALCQVALLADHVHVHALELEAGPLPVVVLARLPIELRMAGLATFLELPLVLVLMTVRAPVELLLVITLGLMALGALGVPVLAYKRITALPVMVKGGLGPA